MTPDIYGLACARFGSPNRRLSTKKTLRFGKHGSVSVELSGPRSGAWYDFEALQGGYLSERDDGLHDRPQAPLRSYGPLTFDSSSEVQFQRTIDLHIRAVPGTSAERYLASRGITSWPDHSVYSWTRGGIAYLARMRDGSPYAVQVLPLHDDGTKNREYWSDGVTKRTYIRAHGWQHFAAVRLPGRGEPILCEGPETALSVWMATGRPVNACLGISGIRDLRAGKRLTIARDGDAPDSPADRTMLATADLRRAQGVRVRIATPPLGTDFNDLHRSDGLDAVAKIIRSAK